MNGVLGPHEGKELALMLNHKKNVALFNNDLGIPAEFFPYIKQGIFVVLEQANEIYVSTDDFALINFIVYRKGYEVQAEKLKHLLAEGATEFIPEIEREIGRILGYNEQDIEFYLVNLEQHLKRREEL